MTLAPVLIERFRRNLANLCPADARFGLAVSGGPDSTALLLLAAAARPGLVEAATVDHGLRPESRGEAEQVAALCAKLAVPHAILTAQWAALPETAVQERARAARYRLLADWAQERSLAALATAHHLDDQVETFTMRLLRGAGVKGLAAMRPAAPIPGAKGRLIRPLLGWRRSELEAVCASAGVTPVADPSNADPAFERVRIRQALADAPWLDMPAVSRSIANLGRADVALDWAAAREWERSVTVTDDAIAYRPGGSPSEIRRRIVVRAIAGLAREGRGIELRGREADRLLAALRTGAKVTVRGILCSGGEEWRFVPAPVRTRPADNSR
jgi:tRNA(Ile)-lysidine synthase